MTKQQHTSILGIPFSRLTLDQTVQAVSSHLANSAAEKSPLFHVITANPEAVMTAREDAEFRDIMLRANMVTPDGIGIVLASKWKGEPLTERVTGYEILLKLLEQGQKEAWSFYLLGADEETNRKAAETIEQRYPGVRIVGRHNGFFTKEQEPEIIRSIAEAKPQLLIVALGIPYAEKWISKHRHSLNASFAMGVGGSLDVIAGKVKRAPVFWQKLNLEWLYRLLKQPSRWRRQLALPRFALTFLLHRHK
jgi:N-acetylglucosaminyldiphosphoundecaprenol N-acetyl-beta-D-mannosaminyltransferase